MATPMATRTEVAVYGAEGFHTEQVSHHDGYNRGMPAHTEPEDDGKQPYHGQGIGKQKENDSHRLKGRTQRGNQLRRGSVGNISEKQLSRTADSTGVQPPQTPWEFPCTGE